MYFASEPFWCPCMAINVVGVQYSITVGFSPTLYCLPYSINTTIGEPDQMPGRGFVFAAYDATT